ncbi:N-acetylmuramoyl-L-alanine amidase [Flavobacterium sp. '19STA2R22 D10 B1']|uniref:N-acetylmuramoyl-L-alanine amidase n=1 Tax=Flavobacterium aerium TaxID=3037261 RepID=UPI00278BE680|nr:N-acetylmuramoyl-L-alanine amidase [Flavobacterium sp. '19STA2R22 D10 B1']
MKKITFIFGLLLFTLGMNAQIIVLDPGHGYGTSTSDNPDGRTATEIETALAVGLKTRTLIQNSCTWTAHMTRTTNVNGWISVNQRATMSNNWNADRFLSIHCNAGGGTGTETFYCTYDDANTAPDIAFAKKIQADMVTHGSWANRRCVEDNTFLNYHLGVLRYSSATACLNEIGFVDLAGDAAKLNSDSWRNNFALAYFNSLKSDLNLTCSATAAPGSFTISATTTCSGTQSAINLTWTTSSNATTYDVYRNGNLYAPDLTGNSFLNTYLINAGSTYTYSIKAKNATGSTANSNGTISRTAISCAGARNSATVGLSDLDIKIYPNPNTGKFMLTLNSTITNEGHYEIYDVMGRKVVAQKLSNNDTSSDVEIDISKFPSGVYMLNVVIDNQEFTKKIIKN